MDSDNNAKYGFQTKKFLVRPKQSRQSTRESQPNQAGKFRVGGQSLQKLGGWRQSFTQTHQGSRPKNETKPQTLSNQKNTNNNYNNWFGNQPPNTFNNTSESTKMTKTFNSSNYGLKRKSSTLWQQQKQDFFEQEDKEEELQFILLCQTLDKVK